MLVFATCDPNSLFSENRMHLSYLIDKKSLYLRHAGERVGIQHHSYLLLPDHISNVFKLGCCFSCFASLKWLP